tara:strand:- start:536 stop:1255 length:720 start_codon:yes stop_codon:yes gene_type:complete
MTIHVTPIPRLIDLAVPAFTLGTSNAAGSAATAVASDSTLLAFDATVPTTIATASAAAGSATVTARRDHVHGYTEPAVAVTRLGGQTTESTTTSTTVVDLISIADLTIPVSNPIKFCISTKKSTGASSSVAFGFKLNTTACVLAVAGSNSLIGHTAVNESQMAYGVYEVAPRYNNYQSFTGIYTVTNTSAVMRAQAVGPLGSFNAFSPVAVINDFKITAISTSSVTAGCGLLQLYSFSG